MKKVLPLFLVLSLFVLIIPANTFAYITTTPTFTARTTPSLSFSSGSSVWSPELGLFVALPTSPTTVMISSDGINWNAITTPAPSGNTIWGAITWSPDLHLFVVVGDGSTGIGTDRVMTSANGTTWALGTLPVIRSWGNVVWSHELNMFVAISGTNAVCTTSCSVTSSNGIDWVAHDALPSTSTGWFGLAWSPQLHLFVATDALTASNAGKRVMTSSNGIDWSYQAGAPDDSWRTVVWSPELGLFVVGGAGVGVANQIMTSPDGVNWTLRTSPADANWRNIAWSPELGIFLGISLSGNHFMSSTDGINWITVANSFSKLWASIVWSPQLGMFAGFANGASTTSVMTSNPFAPTISSITSNPNAGNITWTTDESSSSQVNYGPTNSYGSSTTLDSTLTKNHSVSIPVNTNNFTYHYQVSSTYVALNTLSSDNTLSTSPMGGSGLVTNYVPPAPPTVTSPADVVVTPPTPPPTLTITITPTLPPAPPISSPPSLGGVLQPPLEGGGKFTKTLKLHDKGDEVKQLQTYLNSFQSESFKLSPDGNFGLKTQQALMKFQKSKGLKADGVLGKKTREVMNTNH